MSENESKKARRDAARERARVAREKEKARRRRNRVALISGVIVAALAVITVITLVVVQSAGNSTGPGPKNMASDGILLKGNGTSISAVRTTALKAGESPTATKQDDTQGIAHITIYEDYMCPYCNQFETTNMTQIKQWVESGSATLELHPFNLLDSSSLGTKYSSRAANAAACVANYDPDAFLAVNTSFYKNQPSEDTKGLTDAQLVKLVKKAGATNSNIPSCITGGKFRPWVAAETNRVLNDKIPNSSLSKVTGTPTVLVNGKQYGTTTSQPLTDASTFASWVESTVAATAKTGSSTATATPSATASASASPSASASS